MRELFEDFVPSVIRDTDNRYSGLSAAKMGPTYRQTKDSINGSFRTALEIRARLHLIYHGHAEGCIKVGHLHRQACGVSSVTIRTSFSRAQVTLLRDLGWAVSAHGVPGTQTRFRLHSKRNDMSQSQPLLNIVYKETKGAS